jgi:hypothetical protein
MKAILWWDKLADSYKDKLCLQYFGWDKVSWDLTNEDIQLIYDKEIPKSITIYEN